MPGLLCVNCEQGSRVMVVVGPLSQARWSKAWSVEGPKGDTWKPRRIEIGPQEEKYLNERKNAINDIVVIVRDFENHMPELPF